MVVERVESRLLFSQVASSSINVAQYATGNLNSVTAASTATAGQTYTVTVDNTAIRNNGPMTVFCSDATTNVLVDGSPVTVSTSGYFLYQYYLGPGDPPQPIPDAGNYVDVPVGQHTVTFTIDPAAPTQQQTVGPLDSSGNPISYAGAWVVVDGPGFFGTGSSAVPFDIQGSGDHLAFMQQPTDAAGGAAIAPPITVAVENAANGIDTSNNSNITLSLASGIGTLGGTLMAPAINGLATFSNVFIADAGTYTLQAADADTSITSATSDPFTIAGGQHLVFIDPPTAVDLGERTGFTVALEDNHNQIVSSSNDTIQLDIFSPNGKTTKFKARLQGGEATFANLAFSIGGTEVIDAEDLTAIDPVYPTRIEVDVRRLHLVFISPPTSIDFGARTGFEVAIENSQNKIVDSSNADSNDTIQLNFTSPSGKQTQAKLRAHGGVASFQNYGFTGVGTEDIDAEDLSSARYGGVANALIEVELLPLHLSFINVPANVQAGQLTDFTVALENSQNEILNDNLASNDTIELDITGDTGKHTRIKGQLQNGEVNFQMVFGHTGTFTIVAEDLTLAKQSKKKGTPNPVIQETMELDVSF